MILISRFFFHKDYVGLSLWPFIILRDPQLKKDQVLVNHERIHLRQQLELFIIPFYICYAIEWMIGLLKYRNAYEAYKQISFEKEAYKNETNLDYLKQRRPLAFIKYLWA